MMKTICKRTLALLLCALLMVGGASVGAFASDVPDTGIGAVSPADEAEDPVDLPDIALVNYRRWIVVPEGVSLEFNVTENISDGYGIEWRNKYIAEATEKTYTVSADLVRLSDGEIVKSAKPETVIVLRGPLVRWCVERFLNLYAVLYLITMPAGGLRNFLTIVYQDNRMHIEHHVGFWD